MLDFSTYATLYYTPQSSSSKSIFISSSMSTASTIIISSSSEEISFLANQFPMHSNLWRFSGDNLSLSQLCVRRAPENCCSGSADEGAIERILMAIRWRRG
ncbi:hypothetical protein FOWG_17415 [Fusarium oxysporum f. sp. lycopersici MN25]|nr:hypothetical protein FOWG_17415 [Fusarium oxysporum f. sp. lycopersici MN25]